MCVAPTVIPQQRVTPVFDTWEIPFRGTVIHPTNSGWGFRRHGVAGRAATGSHVPFMNLSEVVRRVESSSESSFSVDFGWFLA